MSILLLFTGGVSYAQVKSKSKAEYKGLERWAFKTNALGWAFTVPNFTAEFDLSPAVYNRSTLSLTAKYNWNTKHTVLPYHVFNFAQVRPEYRYYFRTENVEFLKKIVKNPKTNRANYFGVFLDGGSYTFKIGKYGRQGYMCGGGLSFGYGIPMYEYRSGAIDIELGFALGVMAATSDVFVLNELDNRYDVVDEKCKPLHVIPSPVISELSVTFAWRKATIKEKYSKINQAKRMAKLARQDSILMAKQAKEEAKLLAEEAKAQKKQEKLDKKANKGKDKDAPEAVAEGKSKKSKAPKVKEKKVKKEKKPKEEKPKVEKTKEKEKKQKEPKEKKKKDAEKK